MRSENKIASPIKPVLKDKTLVVRLPESWQTLSWAPFNGGLNTSSTIFIHHLNQFAEEDLNQIFRTQVERLGLPEDSAGLVTGAKTEHFSEAFLTANNLWVHTVSTLGLSNARAVGDEADLFPQGSAGTINLIVATNALPDLEGRLEAVHTATMAKAVALAEAGIRSEKSGKPATGTGTDCIVISSSGEIKENYCGMHTALGEIMGKAVKQVVSQCIKRWQEDNSQSF